MDMNRGKLIATQFISSLCGCCRNCNDKKAHIKDDRVGFEWAWLLDLSTCSQPIIFPPNLQEIVEMTKWLKGSHSNPSTY
jgi:hypothetical protein